MSALSERRGAEGFASPPTSKFAWILIAIILIERCIAILLAGPPVLLGDPLHYHDIAVNLATGHGYSFPDSLQFPWMRNPQHTPMPTAMRPPAYPLFLAFFYLLGFSPYQVLWVQALIGALTGWILYRIARRVGLDDREACIALFLYLIYPLFTWYTVEIVTEPLFVLVLLGGVLSTLRTLDRPSWRDSIVAGVLFGIASLTRPTALLIPVGLAPFFIAKRGRIGAATIAVLTLAFALTLLPWAVRNRVVFHRGSGISGVNLFMGTYPPTRGRAVIAGSERPPELERQAAHMDEFQVDSLYLRAALENVRKYPLEQIPLAASKFIRCWFTVADPHMFRPTLKTFLLNAPLLALGVYGWYWLGRRHARHLWMIYFVVGYSMFAHVTTIASGRYNLFSWPFVFMGVGVTLAALAPRWNQVGPAATR